MPQRSPQTTLPEPDLARRTRAGFTLIELLVVVAILGLLLGILLPSLGRAKKSAALLADEASVRGVLSAYLDNARCNGEMLMPGYKYGLTAQDERGQTITLNGYSTGAATGRYPWRLAPYFEFAFEALFPDKTAIEQMRRLPRDDFVYAVSEGPRFGLNTTFLGGDSAFYGWDNVASKTWGATWVCAPPPPRSARRASSSSPARTRPARSRASRRARRSKAAATSASRRQAAWRASGRPRRPPRRRCRRGSGRWISSISGAVVGMLDGHAEALTWNEMNDMRRWSDQATKADWTLPRP